MYAFITKYNIKREKQNNLKSIYPTQNYFNVMKKCRCVSLKQRKLTQRHASPRRWMAYTQGIQHPMQPPCLHSSYRSAHGHTPSTHNLSVLPRDTLHSLLLKLALWSVGNHFIRNVCVMWKLTQTYTLWVKKTRTHVNFSNNCAECGPISLVLSIYSDCQGLWCDVTLSCFVR